jgi:hypothetical protein
MPTSVADDITADPTRIVRRGRPPKRASEFDSRSVKIDPIKTIEQTPLGQEMEHPENITVVDKEIHKLDVSKLAFAEDPIKIIIHRSMDAKFSPNCTDFIAVNGRPAEMLFKNGWVPMGYLPRGQSFYTKRKCVEVLARAKMESVQAYPIERDNEDPRNVIERHATAVLSFSVLEDKNPAGGEWLEHLIRQNL